MNQIALCAHGSQNSCSDSDLVLDRFLGSGPTLTAAEQTGQTAVRAESLPIQEAALG